MPNCPAETTPQEQSISSQLTKVKTILELRCLLLMLKSRILGFDEEEDILL